MSMPPAEVLQTWFEELWNQGREETIERLWFTDAVAHGLPGGDLRGPADFRALYRAFRGAIPDIHISVEKTIAEGDHVAVLCRVTGTHTGEGLGLPPTGRPVEFTGMVIARIADGQLREGWNCFDFLTMYQQLGVVAENPGGAAAPR